MDKDYLMARLDYDQQTGAVTWRHNPEGKREWNARWAGKTAGNTCRRKDGYQYKRLVITDRNGITHRTCLHRIIWSWMTGEDPPEQIDHIDGDATNNQWSNLRAASPKINNRNQSMSSRNTSGVTGVHWSRNAGKWQARCSIDGKPRHLGYYEDIREAEKVVTDARRDSGFSETHGTRRRDHFGKPCVRPRP